MAGGKPAVGLAAPVTELAAKPILVTVGTRRTDGSVQLNPVWFELAEGHFWVNSNTWRTWPKNLRRERDVTMLLVDPGNPDRYAQIHGRLVEVIPDPKHEFIDRLSRRYTGNQFRELEPGEERITLKIEPVSVTGQEL